MEELLNYLTKDMTAFQVWKADKISDFRVWWFTHVTMLFVKDYKKGAVMKYRKKPVIIEAYQTDVEMDIETLEGTMHASAGDYIITGVQGEQYPCKPDIFEATYELVQ